MARPPRKYLLSEINHIMLRGIGHMNLFGEDDDFRYFLHNLVQFKKKTGMIIYAYCLMNNHVHILIKASPEEIPLFFKRIEVSYAIYSAPCSFLLRSQMPGLHCKQAFSLHIIGAELVRF